MKPPYTTLPNIRECSDIYETVHTNEQVLYRMFPEFLQCKALELLFSVELAFCITNINSTCTLRPYHNFTESIPPFRPPSPPPTHTHTHTHTLSCSSLSCILKVFRSLICKKNHWAILWLYMLIHSAKFTALKRLSQTSFPFFTPRQTQIVL